MAAQKGKDLLVKIHDGENYITVAGMRSRRIAFNAETVDVTHAESAGRWRELLEGAGVKRAAIAGRGLFKDEASDALRDGYPRMLINGTDNVVLIPTLRHREITAWYQTKSKDFGGLSPREYLRGKSWDERTRVGLRAMTRFEVLKP